MSYSEKDLASAVNYLAEAARVVSQNIWEKKDQEINVKFLEEHGYASSSEKFFARACISLWNGSEQISLYDLTNLDEKNYVRFIEALMIFRGVGEVKNPQLSQL